jgi:phenylalanine-4-hydroxylase
MDTNQTPTYTGDIAAEKFDPTKEYTKENQEIVFSAEHHAIWADLFAGIHQPYLLEHLCHEYRVGLEYLQLDPLRIPSVAHLNERINPRSGWRIERTAVRYTLADDWYKKFSQRVFDHRLFTDARPDGVHARTGYVP